METGEGRSAGARGIEFVLLAPFGEAFVDEASIDDVAELGRRGGRGTHVLRGHVRVHAQNASKICREEGARSDRELGRRLRDPRFVQARDRVVNRAGFERERGGSTRCRLNTRCGREGTRSRADIDDARAPRGVVGTSPRSTERSRTRADSSLENFGTRQRGEARPRRFLFGHDSRNRTQTTLRRWLRPRGPGRPAGDTASPR